MGAFWTDHCIFKQIPKKKRSTSIHKEFFYGTWSNIFNSNKKEKSLKIKLADKHLYSNSILNAKYLGLDYSKMAKWVYHVCKTKLGFTLKMQK